MASSTAWAAPSSCAPAGAFAGLAGAGNAGSGDLSRVHAATVKASSSSGSVRVIGGIGGSSEGLPVS